MKQLRRRVSMGFIKASLAIDPEQWERINELARRDAMSRSAVVGRLLARALAEKEREGERIEASA